MATATGTTTVTSRQQQRRQAGPRRACLVPTAGWIVIHAHAFDKATRHGHIPVCLAPLRRLRRIGESYPAFILHSSCISVASRLPSGPHSAAITCRVCSMILPSSRLAFTCPCQAPIQSETPRLVVLSGHTASPITSREDREKSDEAFWPLLVCRLRYGRGNPLRVRRDESSHVYHPWQWNTPTQRLLAIHSL
jgi:hypothetical protein